VVVQALACGTPVVATDCAGGGPRHVLAGGRYGRLLPVGDAEALAAALEEVLAHRPPPAPAESWRPYGQEAAAAAYLEHLGVFGGLRPAGMAS
jgi:glycosyltransferase involved in cell wall biosynthesis